MISIIQANIPYQYVKQYLCGFNASVNVCGMEMTIEVKTKREQPLRYQLEL
jgi:hypothetical protein